MRAPRLNAGGPDLVGRSGGPAPGRAGAFLIGLLVMLFASSASRSAPVPRYDPPARARTGPPLAADSAAVPDTVLPESVAADSAGLDLPSPRPFDGAGRGGLRRGRPPTWSVTVRSGLVPGWGQLVNGKPVKAALLLVVDAWWLGNALREEGERSRLEKLGDVDGVNRAVDRRNAKLWMMGATAVYAMLDAYVDSFFTDYDEGWTGRIGLDPEGRAVAALSYQF